MRIGTLPDAMIIDLGDTLVVVPSSVQRRLDTDTPSPCSGFIRFTTRAGRPAIRVVPGTGYILSLVNGRGDRSWNNWDDRQPVRSSHGDVFAVATPTSNGGGCWFEITITPNAGYESRYEASLADELAP